jgi:hypothetical protein
MLIDHRSSFHHAGAHMLMLIDLANPADVRAALELLPKYDAAAAQDSEGPVEERFVQNLWTRIGYNLQRLVKEVVNQHPAWITIDTLAKALNREAKSVKASLNGPLARAIKSAREAIPGAPELFEWRHNGTVFELGLTPAMHAALLPRQVGSDFETIPEAE